MIIKLTKVITLNRDELEAFLCESLRQGVEEKIDFDWGYSSWSRVTITLGSDSSLTLPSIELATAMKEESSQLLE